MPIKAFRCTELHGCRAYTQNHWSSCASQKHKSVPSGPLHRGAEQSALGRYRHAGSEWRFRNHRKMPAAGNVCTGQRAGCNTQGIAIAERLDGSRIGNKRRPKEQSQGFASEVSLVLIEWKQPHLPFFRGEIYHEVSPSAS